MIRFIDAILVQITRSLSFMLEESGMIHSILLSNNHVAFSVRDGRAQLAHRKIIMNV